MKARVANARIEATTRLEALRLVARSSLARRRRVFELYSGGQQRGRAEEMWRFPHVNFAKIAEDFGCAGIRVEHPRELGDALRRAIAMERPVVVDVVTDMYAIAPHPWTATGRDFHSYQKA